MTDIFISYARGDLDRVRLIVKLIEDNGWSVFWDRTIPPGLTWREYIGKALDEAKCVIVIWSRNSVKSEFVQEEADDGRERKILFPIRIDDVRPPLGFRAIQHEDFTDWKGEPDHRRAKSLIKAIESFAGKPKKEVIMPPAKQKSEVHPPQNQVPASKTEEPREDSPPNTPLRPPYNREQESSHKKRKISFFFKLGPMFASLTVAAVILTIGLNFWVKDQNRLPTTSTQDSSPPETEITPSQVKPEEPQKPPQPTVKAPKPEVSAPATKAAAPKLKQEQQVATKPSETSPQKTFTNSIDMEFVLIPAGNFIMGSRLTPEEVVQKYEGKEGLFQNEHPQHNVKISKPFYMQTTEVTVGQWRKFIKETGYKTEAESGGGAYALDGSVPKIKKGTYWDNPGFSQDDRQPLTCVSWNDVLEFIRWLNQKEGTDKYRLPTEAEWEYVSRAGSATIFSFGDDASKLIEYAWYIANSGNRTHPVAQKKDNKWGLYDMHGNVGEWVEDDAHDTYDGAPANGSAWIEKNRGTHRVVRGGGWFSDAHRCRSAARGRLAPAYCFIGIGFRLAKSVSLGS